MMDRALARSLVTELVGTFALVFAYDALSVAREMRPVGLPDELAEKLVHAA